MTTFEGEEHPDIADTYTNIAHNHFHLKEYNEALLHYQKAIDIRSTVYGKDHSKTDDISKQITLCMKLCAK